MSANSICPGIRPNPKGDWPEIDPSAFVDPSAQIIGRVVVGPKVYIGPLTVIRSDEVGKDGSVTPIVIEEDTYIQDGVLIHSRAGCKVRIGSQCNIAHGVIIHGPADIGRSCFLALRASLYASTLEDECWVGGGAFVMRATIPSHTMIPPGAMIQSGSDTRAFRITNVKEQEYKAEVIAEGAAMRDAYIALYEAGLPKPPWA